MSDQQPQHAKEELAKFIEKQHKQQEDIDWLNDQAPRAATWTIGKELGELHIGVGIVNGVSERPPRADESDGEIKRGSLAECREAD